ncbi:MAG: penicillin-binding transpeptidase domain-containing protein [bacterium]|nr:penicillin-binding transpeptidase domain-containing protein [bacterium]
MNRPIRLAVLVYGVAVMALVVGLTYWQAIAADQLQDHDQNPRRSREESGQERGTIISADTAVLARSVPVEPDSYSYRREYLYGTEYAHLIGFSSRRFGDQGLEAALDDTLRSRAGLTPGRIFDALIGEDLRPYSIQLTLNHEIQTAAVRALGDHKGGVVAMEPSSGQVLVMAGSPSFNPNALLESEAAAYRDELVDHPDRPLYNRAIGASSLDFLTLEETVSSDSFDRASPLGLAIKVAAVTRDDFRMRPYVVARIFDADSNQVFSAEPQPFDEADSLSEGTFEIGPNLRPFTIQSSGHGTLEGQGGMGRHQSESGEATAWFFGSMPATDPAIIVAVVIEDTNENQANRIGRRVLRAWVSVLEAEA